MAKTIIMMKMVESGSAPPLPPQTLEINGKHPIITGLNGARSAQPEVASKVASQLYANALVEAGLMDDPRTMLPNLNELLADVLAPYATGDAQPQAAADKE